MINKIFEFFKIFRIQKLSYLFKKKLLKIRRLESWQSRSCLSALSKASSCILEIGFYLEFLEITSSEGKSFSFQFFDIVPNIHLSLGIQNLRHKSFCIFLLINFQPISELLAQNQLCSNSSGRGYGSEFFHHLRRI